MWGYGAAHAHWTSENGFGLWLRSCDVVMKLILIIKYRQSLYYDVTREHKYEYVSLLLFYGLVYVLKICMKVSKIKLACL